MARFQPIVILGPTAGGKSELAVEMAEHLGGEIIGADSMQVYRHLDAGTAKPSADLRRRARHHLIDIVDPTEPFTVASWLERADALIDRLPVQPIVVGGTNLYIKALLEGMFEGPGQDPQLRADLATLPGTALHHRLAEVDPAAAERIHHNDRKRLIRALEVFELTGTPISELQQQWVQEPGTKSSTSKVQSPKSKNAGRGRRNAILIGLSWPTETINRRINARVKSMFQPATGESLPDETRRLESLGVLGSQARRALGYQQVLEWIEGRGSLDDAFERTKIFTRRFAKHQRTWMRRFEQVHWLEAENTNHRCLLNMALTAVKAK